MVVTNENPNPSQEFTVVIPSASCHTGQRGRTSAAPSKHLDISIVPIIPTAEKKMKQPAPLVSYKENVMNR
jgi:hypothetical protein